MKIKRWLGAALGIAALVVGVILVPMTSAKVAAVDLMAGSAGAEANGQ